MPPTVRVPRLPSLSTTTCQRVVFEDVNRVLGQAKLVIQSDLTHPKLYAAVTCHLMNEVPLLPSAIYADMAMTAADYLYRKLMPGAPEIGLNVCAVEVHKPVIAKIPPPDDGQHLQMEAVADVNKSEVNFNFRSVTWDGDFIQDHGHGLVRYEDPEDWVAEWQRTKYLVETQIEALEKKLEHAKAHKFLRGLAYKLFEAIVQYGLKYRGMEEVIMDGEDTAATARIRFQTTDADGEFFCSPYFIDNLCHLSGFIANSSDRYSADLTYISNGWTAFKVLKPREISADKEYRCFVKMLQKPGNITLGDVYVLHDRQIVAVFYGCKFQGIPKRAMDVLLPKPIKNENLKALKKESKSARLIGCGGGV